MVNPEDYEVIIENLKSKNEIDLDLRQQLASKAFLHVAHYDIAIANYYTKQFLDNKSGMPGILNPVLEKVADLRYGENPHQNAAFYSVNSGLTQKPFEQLHGKELSYNNIIDIAAAIDIVKSFSIPAATIIKHTNPCGAATGDNLLEAYQKAHDADPISAYGSIVGLNRVVDVKTAELLSKNFIEVIIAPDFDKEAFEILSKKTALRLIKTNDNQTSSDDYLFRYIDNSFLVQSKNDLLVQDSDLEIVTSFKPSKADLNDLMFAFNLVKYVKSNAILIANNGQSLGIGAGQMSRVDAVEIALKKAGEKARGAVLASDAFFPFKDSIELAAKYGIRAIIQPGGSKRDQESIDACEANKICMAFSGSRHFLH